MRRYWLLKSEPETFSFIDLLASPLRTAGWEGVRNYEARNAMRAMRRGDGVLFHHSSTRRPGIVGTAVVAREAYPDPSQFDPSSPYHDPRATLESPRWFQVDVRAELEFPELLPLERLRAEPGLAGMALLRKGSRLSVQPVTAGEWARVLEMAGLAVFS